MCVFCPTNLLLADFLSYKNKVGLWDQLPLCLSHLSTFIPISRVLLSSERRSCHWRWPRRHNI
jgi:hypothetical protein